MEDRKSLKARYDRERYLRLKDTEEFQTRIRKRNEKRYKNPQYIEYNRQREADPARRARGIARMRERRKDETFLERQRIYMRAYNARIRQSPEKLEHKRRVVQEGKKRRRADMTHRVVENVRARTATAFNGARLKKQCRTMKIIGCSPVELRWWLIDKFKPGMTPQNIGEWQIDHVIPVSLAKTEEELHVLLHFSNLQPLWKVENQQKGDSHPYASREQAIDVARRAKTESEKAKPKISLRITQAF